MKFVRRLAWGVDVIWILVLIACPLKIGDGTGETPIIEPIQRERDK
jgi:hypothetical protein